LDSVLHIGLPPEIPPQFGEQSPMMIIEDHTHHLVAVLAVRVLTMIVLTENWIVLVVTVTETETVQAGTGIVQAETLTMTRMSEIIIAMSVIAGIVSTTGPGVQKKDGMTEEIVKVAGTGALALATEAEVVVEAGAGAEAEAGVGAGMSSDPAHSGMQIKRRQPPCQAT
jgi:hypothetical protein